MFVKLLVGSSSGYLNFMLMGFSPKVPNKDMLFEAEKGRYLNDFSDLCLLKVRFYLSSFFQAYAYELMNTWVRILKSAFLTLVP